MSATESQKKRIQDKADAINNQYENWFATLTAQTPNLDSYINASTNTLRSFKAFISSVMSENKEIDKVIKSKRIKVIDCIPMAKKKVSSAEDVDAVVELIKEKLLLELKDIDEIDLD